MIYQFVIEFDRAANTVINSFDKLYSKIGYVLDNFEVEIDFEKTRRDYGIAGIVTIWKELSDDRFEKMSEHLMSFKTNDNRVSEILCLKEFSTLSKTGSRISINSKK